MVKLTSVAFGMQRICGFLITQRSMTKVFNLIQDEKGSTNSLSPAQKAKFLTRKLIKAVRFRDFENNPEEYPLRTERSSDIKVWKENMQGGKWYHNQHRVSFTRCYAIQHISQPLLEVGEEYDHYDRNQDCGVEQSYHEETEP